MTNNEEPLAQKPVPTPTTPKPMPTWATVSIGALVIGAAVVLGLFLRAMRVVNFPPLSDDPPVTVSDSSLHVFSPHGWQVDTVDANGHQVIRPKGSTLQATCGYSTDESARLSYNGATWDISPNNAKGAIWMVTITYADHAVEVTLVGGTLQIKATDGSFDPPPANDNHRKHHKEGGQYKTTHITVSGANVDVDEPIDTDAHGHYTLGFCYP